MTTVTVTGYPVDGMNDVGGESTGWKLQTDDLRNIEVDVEQVMAQALRVRQQFVTITGHYVKGEHIERGQTEVLVAEQICLAPGR